MTRLQELIAQKEALEAQIAEQRSRQLADAVGKIKALVEEHGLTAQDIFGTTARSGKTKEKSVSKVAAKYRDPISGATWSGRGLAPKWLAGKNKEDFAISV